MTLPAGNRPTVVVTEWIDDAGIDVLERFAKPMRLSSIAADTLESSVTAAAAIISRVARITPAVIDAASDLQIIQKHGVGVDAIDIAHATARGIPVCCTPEANYIAVAEHAVASALAVMKRLAEQDRITRDGRPREEIRPQVLELAGRTAGVIGAGRIGRRVLQAFGRGFEMRMMAYDPYLTSDAIRRAGAAPAKDLHELLAAADIVSLHVPLSPETRHLIDANALRAMRPTAVLVNTCRGAVVDESALADALRAGEIAGAAIDVFEQEPPTDSPLLLAPNALLSPHNAGVTEESSRMMAVHAAEEVERVLGGQRPKWCLNAEVLSDQTRG